MSLTVDAYANTLDLNSPHHNIGHSMIMYEDKKADLTYDDILKINASSFKPLNENIFSTPFSSSAYWFKFTVKNTQDKSTPKLIFFEPPWLDYIEVNIASSSGEYSQIILGNTFYFEKREIRHALINFLHEFDPGVSTVYMRVKTRDPFVFAVSILDEKDFLLYEMNESRYVGFIYGVMLALLFYNLFLYVGIKEPYYAYYVLFVTAFLLMNASYNGYTFEWFFPYSPTIQTWIQSSSIIAFSLAGLLFSRSFLNLKKFHQDLDVLTKKIIIIYFILTTATALFVGYTLHVILAVVFSGIISSYVLFLALYSWRHGNRSARLFFMGSASGLIGTIITSSSVVGLIPFTYVTYKALDYGMVIDAILLSLALADRVRITNRDKIVAEQASMTDFLTGLKNRRAYYEISSRELHRLARYKGELSLITIDADKFKRFNDDFGHDVGDEVLKKIASILESSKREDDYVFRMGGDEFLLLLPETDKVAASQMVERIRLELENNRLIYNGVIHSIKISAGVASFLSDDTSMQSVEKRADQAMYEAKKSANHIEGSSINS